MVDKMAEVFSRVNDAVKTLCGSVSQTYQERPENLPHVFVDMTDNAVMVTDMENAECAVMATIEITAYTKQNLASAKEILGMADSEMHKMDFQRICGPKQVTGTEYADVTRVMARYQRLIADGDVL